MEILYVGTYTDVLPHVDGKGEGVHAFKLDRSGSETKVEPLGSFGGKVNPSFIYASPKGVLFSTTEVPGKVGAVRAYSIQKNGHLLQVNEAETNGFGPCYLDMDPESRNLLVSNYSSGNIVSFSVDDDNRMSQKSFHQFSEFSGVVPDRQEASHPHSIVLHPNSKWAYAPDLGADRIWCFEFNTENGNLATLKNQPYVKCPPGTGPRHVAFCRDRLYLAGELSNTVVAYAIGQDGTLKETQLISTLPDDFVEENTVADIHVTPDQKYLYVSNRGHDSLVGFKLEWDGVLTRVGWSPTGGSHPRNFLITRDGSLILVANQDTDNITFFRPNDDGTLKMLETVIDCPTPVCLKIYNAQ